MSFIPLFTIIPLAAAFVISLIGKKLKGVGGAIAAFSTAALVVVSVYACFAVKNAGLLVYEVGGWVPPIGISMVLDGFASFMLITVNVIAFLVTVYSINYMDRYTAKWNFYTLFMLMLAGMNGVIITGDMFNLFVFLEIASIASYALVAFGVEREELEAAFKYMVMGTVASCFILVAIALLYSHTSTLNMADMAVALTERPAGYLLAFVSVLFIMGFGLKAALVPFHAWLPDAHPSAPAPISAMLSGVFIKTLGIYALARILFNVFGMSEMLSSILMVLGVLSMIIGVFLAVGQWDLKRLLAYHSISQVGYIMLGLGLATPLGILGGLFHLLNHSVFKSLLFLNSGAIDYALNTRDLKKMGGLRQVMPTTANTSFVASMSIAGIPPFNGFWSKFIIIIACIQAGRPVFAVWAVIGSILTLASFMKVQKYAFFGTLRDELKNIKEVPLSMRLAMAVLALLCIFGGVLLAPVLKSAFLDIATQALVIGKEYAIVVLGKI
ncbi:complex I subunit 5 family protein [Candidatus Omnitrophota bacterium]